MRAPSTRWRHAPHECGSERVGCTELELASLPARFVNVFETITEAGVLLLRALDGHEPSLRVQPRLQLVPDPSPPSILFFGSTFREWNAVRSNGVGAGRTPPGPIFLSAHPPPLGAKPLGAKLGSLAAAPAPRMARKFLATRAAAHRENMLSEGLSFLLLSVRPSTEAGLGVAAHMQSVSSCQGVMSGWLWGNCPYDLKFRKRSRGAPGKSSGAMAGGA